MVIYSDIYIYIYNGDILGYNGDITGYNGIYWDMGVASQSWGYPKVAGWFILWKIRLKWMMTRGTHISGNLHMSSDNMFKKLQ